ncbi:MAG TPA: hypothetical protein VGZ91_13150 [Candidatus Sulfotelmatobacter sp.]|nr:hypothetical protein [Candidatus Sulfotelmatobacter sp.]
MKCRDYRDAQEKVNNAKQVFRARLHIGDQYNSTDVIPNWAPSPVRNLLLILLAPHRTPPAKDREGHDLQVVPIKPAKKELGFSPCGTPTAPWSDVALDRVGRTLLSDAFDPDFALAFDLLILFLPLTLMLSLSMTLILILPLPPTPAAPRKASTNEPGFPDAAGAEEREVVAP